MPTYMWIVAVTGKPSQDRGGTNYLPPQFPFYSTVLVFLISSYLLSKTVINVSLHTAAVVLRMLYFRDFLLVLIMLLCDLSMSISFVGVSLCSIIPCMRE